jgi:hypothetical protein
MKACGISKLSPPGRRRTFDRRLKTISVDIKERG